MIIKPQNKSCPPNKEDIFLFLLYKTELKLFIKKLVFDSFKSLFTIEKNHLFDFITSKLVQC